MKVKQEVKKFLLSSMSLFTNKVGFKREEVDYYQTYLDENETNELGECLIVMFDGKQIHCGLTDRFKGICTAYEFSKEFNMKFYINYISPFELTDYLIPNLYDWKVDVRKVLYNKSTSVPVFLNDWQSNTFYHKLYLQRIIKDNPGKQIHLYTNSPYYLSYYSDTFHYLFKNSSMLDRLICSENEKLGDGYVAMSFRFLQLLGDFKEEHAVFKVLPEEAQFALMQKCEQTVLSIRKTMKISKKILLTADSHKFLDYMCDKYDFVYSIPGPIAHIDNCHEKNNDIYTKVFLDMIMLSKSRVIYQICIDDMYRNSAFAKHAALLGNVKYIKIVI